jgi:hypothetical protein
MRQFLLAAAAGIASAVAATTAHAQAFPVPGTGGTLNPYNYYDPYGNSRQAAFNIALYGQAMSQVPPYALGYNPYPQVVNYGPVYGHGYYPGYSYYYGPGYAYYSWYSPPQYSHYWYWVSPRGWHPWHRHYRR